MVAEPLHAGLPGAVSGRQRRHGRKPARSAAAAVAKNAAFSDRALFGLGLGNMISLLGLIVQQEFPKEQFARIVSLIVAINQFSFAFGPGLLGQLQGQAGGYGNALLACLAMQAAAAVLVVLPVLGRSVRPGTG